MTENRPELVKGNIYKNQNVSSTKVEKKYYYKDDPSTYIKITLYKNYIGFPRAKENEREYSKDTFIEYIYDGKPDIWKGNGIKHTLGANKAEELEKAALKDSGANKRADNNFIKEGGANKHGAENMEKNIARAAEKIVGSKINNLFAKYGYDKKATIETYIKSKYNQEYYENSRANEYASILPYSFTVKYGNSEDDNFVFIRNSPNSLTYHYSEGMLGPSYSNIDKKDISGITYKLGEIFNKENVKKIAFEVLKDKSLNMKRTEIRGKREKNVYPYNKSNDRLQYEEHTPNYFPY